ncbi:glycosyltransferase family 2 protein [Arsukibacterium sp.]|uniref:glycosyltransferase family 2 protein n=1 Tax=Arsukibacterium sp. TaxID=1977258 RepID=UPI001BD37705|nr:glycosyltransferase family 2 protein [Arsukibacterium sp.]
MVIRHIKKFKQTIFGKPVRSGSPEHLHALITESGYFDHSWYLTKYPDIASHYKWATDPVGHYLRHGASEGRNPSAEFKTQWYLRENPDVQQAGMNPLVHYILHGMDEGRLPNAKARKRGSTVNLNKVETLRAKLWSGYARYALPLLEQKAIEQQKSNANWHLAAWHYAHGDFNKAINFIEQDIEHSEHGASRRKLVALVKCLSQQKQLKPLQALLTKLPAKQQLAQLLPYAEANAAGLANDTAGQLAAVNRLFAQFDLAEVALLDESKPLLLENLQANAQQAALSGDAKVSVIIPAYNAAQTIGIALHSLTQQTWQNLEILVVDDASTDNTAQVVKQWCQQDKRIRYLANPQNMGAYPSRNNGMQQAAGDFVTVHDSDDWSHPEKIARQLAPMLDKPAVKATYSSWVRVLPDMTFVGSWYLNDVFVEKNHSSLLLRRSTLEQTGLWDGVNVAADTEFLWRLEHHFGQSAIKHILPGAPLSFALSDDSSLTRTKASHVKTIHFGLRRLYREASRWWHRQSESGGFMDATQRPFPLPLGIVRGSPRHFDSLLVADFATADDGELKQILMEAKRRFTAKEKLCFFHWPGFMQFHGAEIHDDVFAFCQQYGVQFAHAGIEINCPKIVIAGQRLLEHIPDQVVAVRGVKAVIDLSGEKLDEQQSWCRLWQSGAEVDAPTALASTETELPEAPPIAALFAERTTFEPFPEPQWQRDNRQFVKENLYKNGFIAALNGAEHALTATTDIADWVKLEWADWHVCLQNKQLWHFFGNRLAIIGTAFDPYNKIFEPQQLLQHLAGKLGNESAFLNALDNLSGKFVLLARHDDGWKLYNDAFSSCSIFYHDERTAGWLPLMRPCWRAQ